ncbi:MAG: winged helix-turn-helix transcriptional regulator [Candidatus Eisenbacteria bacterium]|uniref:Winged helix-turn-helix transcriptional regulator n=1 Tax=Eiseniibacteriota bacterium TaxID=2212470 RepID=A0A7Y2H319_UNCEI|nr:winged helix-turn-helix transcriptional regulator [Candidatus Eisenbacteria bacterium]
MVNYPSNPSMAQIFSALADPTRLSIVERLNAGPALVSDLARPFAMSAPAISRHLRVLERAGLIHRAVRGRHHWIHLNPTALSAMGSWINPMLNITDTLQPSLSRRLVIERTRQAAHADSLYETAGNRSLRSLLLKSRLEESKQANQN